MIPWILGVLATVLSGVLLAAVTWLVKTLNSFIKEQRAENENNNKFIRSMQRAEIIRYFRIVVEQGNPITPEELGHLTECYETYHDNGGNGSGTVMFNKILDHVHIVTTADVLTEERDERLDQNIEKSHR